MTDSQHMTYELRENDAASSEARAHGELASPKLGDSSAAWLVQWWRLTRHAFERSSMAKAFVVFPPLPARNKRAE